MDSNKYTILIILGIWFRNFKIDSLMICWNNDYISKNEFLEKYLTTLYREWATRKQCYVSLSIMESEYVTLSVFITEALWLRYVLNDMHLVLPIVIFEDNQSCISIAKDPCNHWRSKHIDKKYHFLRDVIKRKEFTKFFY